MVAEPHGGPHATEAVGRVLTGFRGLERQVNSGEGVGGQGVAAGASPQRPSAQGAGSGTPAWGSSNLPDPCKCKVLVPRRTVDQVVREDHTNELVALRAVHQGRNH